MNYSAIFSFNSWCKKYDLDANKAAIVLGLSRAQSYKLYGGKSNKTPTEQLILHCDVFDAMTPAKSSELICKRLLASAASNKRLKESFDCAQWFTKYRLTMPDAPSVLGKSNKSLYAYLNYSTEPTLAMVLHCDAIDFLGHDDAHLLVARRKMNG
jgi:hypothetical protein